MSCVSLVFQSGPLHAPQVALVFCKPWIHRDGQFSQQFETWHYNKKSLLNRQDNIYIYDIYISHRIHGAGIYANLMVDVSICSIHGSYGIYRSKWQLEFHYCETIEPKFQR